MHGPLYTTLVVCAFSLVVLAFQLYIPQVNFTQGHIRDALVVYKYMLPSSTRRPYILATRNTYVHVS